MKKYYKFKHSIATLDFTTVPPIGTDYIFNPFPVTIERKVNYVALDYLYDPYEIPEKEFAKWKDVYDKLDKDFDEFKRHCDQVLKENGF